MLNGFTLLELLVVIVIIGLLAAFVAPRYFNQIGRSKAQIALAQIESFDKALEQFRLDTGHYPNSEVGLSALFIEPVDEPMWHGAYLKKSLPLDPWDHPYVYRMPGTNGRDFEVLSLGGDGKAGGAGEDADITN
ncbi:type II secretion system major pseudopilin GspG [Duganella sp. BuS-21]|uniref:type II secretion system major pseudopilin GspG n=1 Tax=Duganella sp. BuS-21 TaxID=2943848 RepID=UPI0035A66393